jgi:hypothetical protein
MLITINKTITLKTMVVMRLPSNYLSVILDKNLSSIYREVTRNSENGRYTTGEAHYLRNILNRITPS